MPDFSSGSVFRSSGLINFRVTETQGARNRGRFTSQGLSAMRERNRQMAMRIQRTTADMVSSRIIWRFESTGRLAKNTLASENAQYDTWRVAVGNPDFLDRSDTKYWRTIEQGSQIWTHPFAGTHLWPRRGGIGPPPGRGRPSAPKGVLGGFWTDKVGRSPVIVSHEIEGQHSYQDAAIEASLRDFAIRNVEQTVRDILR